MLLYIPNMADKWQITVNIEDDEDKFQLTDIKEVLDGYLNINRTFFDELLDIVKMIKKYSIGKGIEQVIGPDKEDWSKNSWLFIIFRDKEKFIPFWLLFKREKDLNGHLVAIGPDSCYEYFRKSKVASDEVRRIIEYLLAYPQKFEVLILIPSFVE